MPLPSTSRRVGEPEEQLWEDRHPGMMFLLSLQPEAWEKRQDELYGPGA